MEVKFFNCTDILIDRYYNQHSGSFLLKLKSGDQVVADICWRQGRHNNYYFYSEYFDKEIPVEDVLEIATISQD